MGAFITKGYTYPSNSFIDQVRIKYNFFVTTIVTVMSEEDSEVHFQIHNSLSAYTYKLFSTQKHKMNHLVAVW